MPAPVRNLLLSLCLVAPAALVTSPVLAAEDYYLRAESSRLLTGSGEPLQGARLANRLVCKADAGCYDLRVLKGDAPYGLSLEAQEAYRRALRALALKPEQQVPLSPAVGRALYRDARRGWDRLMSDD